MTGAAPARSGADATTLAGEVRSAGAVPGDDPQVLERLRSLLDAAPVGLAELDPAGRLVLANRTLLTLAGRGWPELRARRWTQLAHHYDRPSVEQLWASAAPSRVQLRVTFRLAATGADRWVEVLAAPGPEGGWVLVLADAGERVAASAALVDSERWLRAVLDAVPVGLAVQTLDGRTVAVNEAMARALGSTVEEVGAAAPGDLPFVDEHGSDVAVEDQPPALAVRTGRPAAAVLGTTEGGRRWLQVSAQALPLDDENAPRGVVTTAVDVTADRERAARLAESERRHHALLEAPGDALLELAPDGRCRHAAAAGGRALGGEVRELVGRSLADLVHPDDAAALSGLLAAPSPEEAAFPATRALLRVRRRDGSHGWVQAVAAADVEPGAGGRLRGWLVQLRDVDALVTGG